MAKTIAVWGGKVQEGGEDLREKMMEESMKFIGFTMEYASPQRVEGRFVVTKNSCQPFGVLHGGVSALIAESLASFGAHIASGFERVAGVQLSINHLRAAPMGTEVFASAKPIQMGKRIQVWEVSLFKVDSAQSVPEQNSEVNTKLAVSRVTLMAGLTGQVMDHSNQEVKLHARL